MHVKCYHDSLNGNTLHSQGELIPSKGNQDRKNCGESSANEDDSLTNRLQLVHLALIKISFIGSCSTSAPFIGHDHLALTRG